jgi:hypothetical protein
VIRGGNASMVKISEDGGLIIICTRLPSILTSLFAIQISSRMDLLIQSISIWW